MKVPRILRTKSFWTGIAAIAAAVGMWEAGKESEAVQTAIGGLAIIFLRQGIEKSGPEAQNGK